MSAFRQSHGVDRLAALSFAVISQAEEANSSSALNDAVRSAARSCNATVCVGLRLTRQGAATELQLSFGCAPDDWRRDYGEGGQLAADPLVAHALASPEPRAWSDDLQTGHAASSTLAACQSPAWTLGMQDAFIIPQLRTVGLVSAVLFAGLSLSLRHPSVRHALTAQAAALQRAADRIRFSEARSRTGVRLSRREAEAVYWVGAGLTDKAVALAMRLSPDTVTGYLRSARRKLGAKGRIGIVRRATELDLLPLWISGEAP